MGFYYVKLTPCLPIVYRFDNARLKTNDDRMNGTGHTSYVTRPFSSDNL